MVFTVGYSINEKMRKSGALNEHLKVTVYIVDREAKTIDIPMRDFIDSQGWQHKNY